MKDTLIRFLLAWSLIATCLLFMQRNQLDKPLLVYHADNKYHITGKVTEKRKIGSLFTITVNGNVFVVSEQKYNNTEIGKEVKL
mgnify:CR=1 FL=1